MAWLSIDGSFVPASSCPVGLTAPDRDVLRRISAASLENFTKARLARLLPTEAQPVRLIKSVRVEREAIELAMPIRSLFQMRENLADGEFVERSEVDRQSCILRMKVALPLRGGPRLVQPGHPAASKQDPALIKALRKANGIVTYKGGRPTLDAAPASVYDRRILRLAFLAPDIQRDILAGAQPPSLSLQLLMERELPLSWQAQRGQLRWT